MSATQTVALRGVVPARRVVLTGGAAMVAILIAALAGVLERGLGGRLVASTTLGALVASLAVLVPSRAACAVRRAAMGTLFQVGFLVTLWLLVSS